MKKIVFIIIFFIIASSSCKDSITKNKKEFVSKPKKKNTNKIKGILTTTKDTIYLTSTELYNVLNLDSITKKSKRIKAKYHYSHKSMLNKKLIKLLNGYENSVDLKKIRSALRLIQKNDTFSIDIKQNAKLPKNLGKDSILEFNLSVYDFYYHKSKSNYVLIDNAKLIKH